ncbi:sensor histidine kinase [Nitrospira sp. Kam-Ns4a]
MRLRDLFRRRAARAARRASWNPWVVGVSASLFLLIVGIETVSPANVVGAYGFVLPILLIATARNRRLMVLTVALCVIATYAGLFAPTKPGRFVSAVINRTVVVCVLIGVAYFAMTREERKAREEAARAALALQTEQLLRAHAQLAEIKDALNRSERLAAMGQLVASVAHEVGTPLHSIAWHVQALGEEDGLTPAMRKRIDIIDSQISRVVRIIEDLLSSTRQRQPAFSRLAADQLVQQVVALMGPSFAGKGVALKTEVGTVGLALWGDEAQLQQVLVNLMANALAATPAGGEVVIAVGQRAASPSEIEARRRAGEPPVETMVTLTVRDTGIGMSEEHRRRAVEPFFTTKAVGDGTGLGLYLSRQIVAAHGGSLTIESELGKGTTVVIALPRCAAEEEPTRG